MSVNKFEPVNTTAGHGKLGSFCQELTKDNVVSADRVQAAATVSNFGDQDFNVKSLVQFHLKFDAEFEEISEVWEGCEEEKTRMKICETVMKNIDQGRKIRQEEENRYCTLTMENWVRGTDDGKQDRAIGSRWMYSPIPMKAEHRSNIFCLGFESGNAL